MVDLPKIKVEGTDNKIVFLKNGEPVEEIVYGLNITITGNNNYVEIELPSKFSASAIVINGDNNKFVMKSTKKRNVRHTTFGLEGGSEIYVGSGISCYRDVNIVAKNGKNIFIGDECMFARDIMVRNNDGHIILDRKTGEVINPPEDIRIGDNVWIGMKVMVLKGSEIPNGSVVGAMSMVNKKFDEENILLAGAPAQIIRHDIEWRREDFAMYMNK